MRWFYRLICQMFDHAWVADWDADDDLWPTSDRCLRCDELRRPDDEEAA